MPTLGYLPGAWYEVHVFGYGDFHQLYHDISDGFTSFVSSTTKSRESILKTIFRI